MNIGTHNSMSYLPPKKWYMWPFRFIAKCQKKNIEEQYKLGARMFDLRVSFDDNAIPEFRHGSMAYKGDVHSVLETLNNLPNKVYVRLVLEIGKNNKEPQFRETLFSKYCAEWEKEFTNLRFFEGTRKYDWKVVYNFKRKTPNIVQKISSMTGSVLDDWYPWLYARFNNKKNIANHKGKEWLLVDFIEIQ